MSKELVMRKDNESNIIHVRNLTKKFNQFSAVNDISFQVKRGELFGFLGVNGAGKSTTINMLCTLFAQTAGEVTICGHQLGLDNKVIREKIGVVFQGNTLDDQLTIKQNLTSRAYLYEKDRKKVERNLEYIYECLDIRDLLKWQYRELSGGQKRRCEIARALVNRPEILFLDEPTTGLDPQTRQNVWNVIDLLRNELNMTVFLTTHYMDEAVRAEHIAIMDCGKIVEDSTPHLLKEKYASDQIKLFGENSSVIVDQLKHLPFEIIEKSNHIAVNIPSTMESFKVLDRVKECIQAFEVVQGTMEDVFLNITGRDLTTEQI